VWSAGKTGRLQGGLSPRAEPLLTHSNQHLKPTWPSVIVCEDLMHGGRDSCLFVVAERMHKCMVIGSIAAVVGINERLLSACSDLQPRPLLSSRSVLFLSIVFT